MCGIVGAGSTAPQADRTWLAPARDTLTHRGPDDAGEWWSEDGRMGLSHRRLSILDLSLLGHQPMHLAERGLSIVFNGEIYNFAELRRELEGLGHGTIFYKKLFDFMWVCGQPQYSYAQRFGYGIDNTISNLYSADTNIFNSTANCCRRFAYVGRFVTVKALDLLVESYCRLPIDTQEEWPLVLIGDGDQKEMILSRRNRNIKVMPFMQPDELKSELLKGGVACLPSHKDQWGVVVHEYALMGLPMLLSTGCGAATEFLIPGYNGLMFEKGNIDSLHRALQRFTELSNDDLFLFGKNSTRLGSKIDSQLSAHSLISVALR